MTDRFVYIGDLTREICRRFNVDPSVVSSISITPGRVVFAVFQMADNDRPAMFDGEPVIELLTFTIRTERAKSS